MRENMGGLGSALARAAVVVLALMDARARGFMMDVEAGTQRCVGETVGEKIHIDFTFSEVQLANEAGKKTGGGGVTVNVRDPHDRTVYKKPLSFTPTNYEFQSPEEGGAYEVCFLNSNRRNSGEKRRVEYQQRRRFSAKDYSSPIKSEDLQEVDLVIKRAQDASQAIDHEMEYMMAREKRMRQTTESMQWRIKMFSSFSIVVLCLVAAWQTYRLNRFFKAKKLI